MHKKPYAKNASILLQNLQKVLDSYIIMCYNNYSKGKGSSPEHKGYNGGKNYEKYQI